VSDPVVLWDIDGTLVRSNGGRVAVDAFLCALRLSCQLEHDLRYPTDSSGKTDPQIALELLAAASIGEPHAAGMLDVFGKTYLGELQQQRDALVTDLRVLPGVSAILEDLRQRGVVQSLLTGNLQPVAKLKLACAGIDGYIDFDLGAYGSDHADRTCLVPIVRGRLRERFGRDADETQIVVVGDTPRDIACARAGGARAIAVATGGFSREQLEQHQPDVLLDDLSDTRAVLEALLQYSSSLRTRPPPSSRGPGRSPFKAEIAGSNPAGGTSKRSSAPASAKLR
jgi:phosphoglycolate phosphatase